jgi:hypothetical protein
MALYEFRFLDCRRMPTQLYEGTNAHISDALVVFRGMAASTCWSVEIWEDADCIYQGPIPTDVRFA